MRFLEKLKSGGKATATRPNGAREISSSRHPTSQKSRQTPKSSESFSSEGIKGSSAQRLLNPLVQSVSDQAFVTDAGFNASAATYRQTTMAKQQRMAAERKEEQSQAAHTQAIENQRMAATQTLSQKRWPSIWPYYQIPDSRLRDPVNAQVLRHLNLEEGHFDGLARYYDHFVQQRCKPGKAMKRDLIAAGQDACEKYNEFLATKWDVFAKVNFTWDAANEEGAFQFFGPAREEDRFQWMEKVKGPYFDKEDWEDWNEQKKEMGL